MIHYFLEGDLGFDYRDSWRKYAGHLELMHWDCSNVPVDKYPDIQKLIDNKKYSMLSDFIRWWTVHEYGGVYLDFDVELIAPLDRVLEFESFVSMEGQPVFPNGAVSGGKKGNKYHAEILNCYFDVINGVKTYEVPIEVACSPWMLKDYVEAKKGKPLDDSDLYQVKEYDGFVTLPKEYFYPYNWNEEYRPSLLTQNTIGIHWWKHSWK